MNEKNRIVEIYFDNNKKMVQYIIKNAEFRPAYAATWKCTFYGCKFE
jgi:hypothetical protein